MQTDTGDFVSLMWLQWLLIHFLPCLHLPDLGSLKIQVCAAHPGLVL